jgi:hypothetical protein
MGVGYVEWRLFLEKEIKNNYVCLFYLTSNFRDIKSFQIECTAEDKQDESWKTVATQKNMGWTVYSKIKF